MSKEYFFKTTSFLMYLLLSLTSVKAQRAHLDINQVYIGELGVAAGGANYFGDLNTSHSFRGANLSGGLFFRYFINSHFGASVHANYAKLGFSDRYNSDSFQHTRNLAFNTNALSFDIRGDFNFFKFLPGSPDYRFTPYLSLGIGIFHFDPHTFYEDKKYFLQPLGTEGQGSDAYPERQKYALWSLNLPIEVGVKYNLNERWNLQLSASYFFTATDYLDDVSTTYAGISAFPPNSMAAILQDRSGVYGTPIGTKGRQRGNPENKDQFVLLQLGISYLFTHYRCP